MHPSYFPSPFPPYRSLASLPHGSHGVLLDRSRSPVRFIVRDDRNSVYMLRAASCVDHKIEAVALLSLVYPVQVSMNHIHSYSRSTGNMQRNRVIPVLDGFERVLTIRWGCALLQKRARLASTNQFKTFDTLRVMVNDQSRNM